MALTVAAKSQLDEVSVRKNKQATDRWMIGQPPALVLAQ